MKDLIKALTIFCKYSDDSCIHCEHEELIVAVPEEAVSEEDKERLEKLSFTPNSFGLFSSFRFGSC